MNSLPATLLALAAAAALTVPAHAQEADWTLEVPLQVTALEDEIRHVVVTCIVSPDPISDYAVQFQALWVGSPGGPFSEVEGLNTPPNAMGVAIFEPDASRAGPSLVEVPVYAHPDMTTAEKLAARYWGCGLAFSVNDDPMYRVRADNPDADYSWTWPSQGATYVPFVSGSFN